MAKSKTNRFQGFEDLGLKETESAKYSVSKTKPEGKVAKGENKGKSANPDFKKVTLYLSKELHLKMRTHALTETETMSDLVERVMSAYFKQLDG